MAPRCVVVPEFVVPRVGSGLEGGFEPPLNVPDVVGRCAPVPLKSDPIGVVRVGNTGGFEDDKRDPPCTDEVYVSAKLVRTG